MMKETEIKRLMARIEKQKKAVAKARDALREIEDEAIELRECCEEAEDNLVAATDALSRLL